MKSNRKDWAIRCNLAIMAALHASWLFYYSSQAPSSTLAENTAGRHIQHNKGFAILMLLRGDNNTVLQESRIGSFSANKADQIAATTLLKLLAVYPEMDESI